MIFFDEITDAQLVSKFGILAHNTTREQFFNALYGKVSPQSQEKPESKNLATGLADSNTVFRK